jgi:hypothetical protein
MKTKRYLIIGSLALITGLAQAASVDEIIQQANQASYYAGKDGMADVTMEIHDSKGGKRVREFRILRLNSGGATQKFYVYFQAPADVRKMAYLVWKNGEKEDDRWLWLPALNLVKRIAPGDKRTSFVGSDFVYEDVSGRSPDADVHELLETTDTQFVIKNTPKNAGEVEFAAYTVWIDKTTYLPAKAEYTDAQGKLYRRVSATKVETIDGIPTVTESMVEDLVTGGKTINRFTNVTYNNDLNDRIFSERFRRRPPSEATR